MIEVVGLKKRFGAVDALKGVGIKVLPGRVSGLLGPNASGKTTLIKSILGLVIPDSGQVRVGEVLADRYGSYRKNIGYLPQNPDFPSQLSVGEMFRMMEDVRQSPALRKDELIELFELGPFLKRPFGVLSGGTKQKVGAVLAFMFDAPVLILDEPTVGLDPVAVVRIKELMRKAASDGKTVLLVSHIMSEIEQLVTDVTFLLDGEVAYSGGLASWVSNVPTGRLEDAVVQLITEKRGRSQHKDEGTASLEVVRV